MSDLSLQLRCSCTYSCQVQSFLEENIFNIFLYFVRYCKMNTDQKIPSLRFLYAKYFEKIHEHIGANFRVSASVRGALELHEVRFVICLQPPPTSARSASTIHPLIQSSPIVLSFPCSVHSFVRSPSQSQSRSAVQCGRHRRCRSRRRRLFVRSPPIDLGWDGMGGRAAPRLCLSSAGLPAINDATSLARTQLRK